MEGIGALWRGYGENGGFGPSLVQPRRLSGMPTRRDAREWLEAAMNGEVVLTPQQFAAAKVLIEYKQPKLGRVGAVPDAETFAVRLEAAIQRSGVSRVIDITPEEPEPNDR
jgi:hypothetical protein